MADPLAAASHLPRGGAVIYRAFGERQALSIALKLRRSTRGRRVMLLVGADERLAWLAGADGLHLPERMMSRLPRIRARHPRWIITTAAHSGRALHLAERVGADAVLLSTVFASRSASATRPMGPVRLAQLVRTVRTPVLALGGVDARSARRLVGTGAAGVAGVQAWRP